MKLKGLENFHIEMADYLVCILTTQENFTKSIVKQCSKCLRDIWVSPSGLFQAGPYAKLICGECVQKCEDTDKNIGVPSDAQLKIIMEKTGKSREEILEWLKGVNAEIKRTGEFPKGLFKK